MRYDVRRAESELLMSAQLRLARLRVEQPLFLHGESVRVRSRSRRRVLRAFSPQDRLAFGYLRRRDDFLWMGIWEENLSRCAAALERTDDHPGHGVWRLTLPGNPS